MIITDFLEYVKTPEGLIEFKKVNGDLKKWCKKDKVKKDKDSLKAKLDTIEVTVKKTKEDKEPKTDKVVKVK